MPELPEVETIRIALSPHLIGKQITSVDIRSRKQFIGRGEEALEKRIIHIHRKGKVFVIELTGNLYISIHLKMSGQLLLNAVPSRSTRVVFHFTDGSTLVFNDMRKFGWIKLGNRPEVPKGHDVVSDEFTLTYFQSVLSKTRKPIKIVLMDQDKLSGIGNIYANDVLYVAGINPLQSASDLHPKAIKKLFEAIKLIIGEGIKRRGSSRENGIYRLPDGTKGTYQNYFKVYAREGKSCMVCKTEIKRMAQGGRSTFYCPVCQPAPG